MTAGPIMPPLTGLSDTRQCPPKPYYEHGGITIYHADCRYVLPFVSADVVLTDPPWELSEGQIEHMVGGVGKRRQRSVTLKRGAVGHFDSAVITSLASSVPHDCLFLCGYKELGQVIDCCKPLRGVFVWHKPNASPAVFYPAKIDVSFIVWTGRKSMLYGRQHWPSMVFSYGVPKAGCMATERYLESPKGKALHPCQGPLSLYLALLRPFDPGLTVLDAYMGTGTTLRAAKDLGMKAIGIEMEERYCELAARRLEQDVFTFEPGEAS